MPPADMPEPGQYLVSANDNNTVDGPAAEPLRNADVIIPQLAHLIGRRMAREDFAACIVGANDNDKGSEGTRTGRILKARSDKKPLSANIGRTQEIRAVRTSRKPPSGPPGEREGPGVTPMTAAERKRKQREKQRDAKSRMSGAAAMSNVTTGTVILPVAPPLEEEQEEEALTS